MSFVHIGKVHSPQGVQGKLFIYLFAQEAAWVGQWANLFLSNDKEESPKQELEIQSIKEHQKQKKLGFVLQLQGVASRDQAEALVGKKVYIPASFLVSEPGEEIYLREVLGFEVIDKTRGRVGVVKGFSGNSLQDLIVIKDANDQEFEVPFVEPIHYETQMDEKKLLFDIPHGLLPDEEL